MKTLKDLYSPTRTITIGEFTVEGLSKRNNRVNTTAKATSNNELHCMYALNEHMSSDEKASVPTMPDWYVVPQWVLKAAHNIQFHHKNTVLDAAAKQNNIFLLVNRVPVNQKEQKQLHRLLDYLVLIYQ